MRWSSTWPPTGASSGSAPTCGPRSPATRRWSGARWPATAEPRQGAAGSAALGAVFDRLAGLGADRRDVAERDLEFGALALVVLRVAGRADLFLAVGEAE